MSPWVTIFSTVELCCSSSFCMWSDRSHSFPSYLSPHVILPTPSLKLLHTFVIQLYSFSTVCIPPVISSPLNHFFLICTHYSSLCVIQSCIRFVKNITACIHDYSTIQYIFTAIITPVALLVNSPFNPQPSGNHC